MIDRTTVALWYVSPGEAVLRDETLQPKGPDHIVVRGLWSGLSRGTERLVFQGLVPESEWQRMRAPLQAGDFPFPVKYGYALVGEVIDGPPDFLGQSVFCLAPHQDCQLVPVSLATPLPQGLPPRRAVLAANMETALNTLWDAEAAPGERILIVGGGVLGMLLAGLASAMPGSEVTVSDLRPERAETARTLGADFVTPDQLPEDQDLVIHTSASEAGLKSALTAAGREARIVEASWYGSRPVSLSLGGAFHSRRLRLISSQVGCVAPSRAPRWSNRRRLAKALDLLQDPRYDLLLGAEIAFSDLPDRLAATLDPRAEGFLPLVRYSSNSNSNSNPDS